MQYRKYMHVEKLGTSETEGILRGTVFLSYKIDGTNAVIWLKEDGTLGFGSRRRELEIGEDNAGFMQLMMSDDYADEYADFLAYLTKYPTRIIYGEWLVRHTLRTYRDDAWRKFYVFDVYDTATDKFIPVHDYLHDFIKYYKNIKYIPILGELKNPTTEELDKYLKISNHFLIKDREQSGEGIVIKNYDFVNKFGRTVWAKMLTEDFKSTRKNTKTTNKSLKEASLIEYEISKLLTDEHILKEKTKIEERYGGWSSKNIFELLNRVFLEFWRDNWEIILKKFKNPTINFKTLKQITDNRVKDVLKID